VLAELMRSGALESHLRLTRARHRRRRDAMLHAVHNYLPHAQIHGAAAGLHLMLTLDTRITDVELAAAALARGVKVHPLSWHSQRAIRPGLVLGYAARTPDEITEGAATIAKPAAPNHRAVTTENTSVARLRPRRASATEFEQPLAISVVIARCARGDRFQHEDRDLAVGPCWQAA
jgi:hypothetical protein